MEFSEVLYTLRKKHNLSQSALAKALGVAQASINYWEKGERTPSIDAVKDIAKHFDISVNDMLGGIITQSKTSIKQVTNFYDYLGSLGYEIGQGEHEDYQMHIKETDTYIELSSKDIGLLESSTRTTIDNTIKLLIATKNRQ